MKCQESQNFSFNSVVRGRDITEVLLGEELNRALLDSTSCRPLCHSCIGSAGDDVIAIAFWKP